jgi:hypothetical protein
MKVNYIRVLDEPDEIPEEIFRLCNNINRIYGLVPVLKGLIAVKKRGRFTTCLLPILWESAQWHEQLAHRIPRHN